MKRALASCTIFGILIAAGSAVWHLSAESPVGGFTSAFSRDFEGGR